MTDKKWHNVLSDYTRITESVTLDDLQGRYAFWLSGWTLRDDNQYGRLFLVIAGPLVLEIT